MNGDELRYVPTAGDDRSRPAATEYNDNYSLSCDEALVLYERAGLPRTPRSIQRYCAKGDLACHRVETPLGVKFLIAPASVDRHIAYIKEVRLAAAGRAPSRQAAAMHSPGGPADEPRPEFATGGDEPRQLLATSFVSQPVATETRIVELLERENGFLRDQVAVKDKQIADMQERAHETNTLINGLQRLLAPILSTPERRPNAGAGE